MLCYVISDHSSIIRSLLVASLYKAVWRDQDVVFKRWNTHETDIEQIQLFKQEAVTMV